MKTRVEFLNIGSAAPVVLQGKLSKMDGFGMRLKVSDPGFWEPSFQGKFGLFRWLKKTSMWTNEHDVLAKNAYKMEMATRPTTMDTDDLEGTASCNWRQERNTRNSCLDVWHLVS